MSYRIAVASGDGKTVDTGFGAAEDFLIYEVNGTEYRLLEKRKSLCSVSRNADVDQGTSCADHENNASGCDGDGNTDCRGHGKHSGMVSAVSDCKCVLCKKIGYGAQKELERKGILSFDIEMDIDEALKKIVIYIDKALKY